MTNEEAVEKIAEYPLHEDKVDCEDTLKEVYDLSMDIEEQFAAFQPRNYPPVDTTTGHNTFDW